MQHLGGTFQVKSEPGHGTVLDVELPAPGPSLRAKRPEMHGAWRLIMNPIRILLADDHTVMRNGLRLLLERQPNLSVVAKRPTAARPCAWPNPFRPTSS